MARFLTSENQVSEQLESFLSKNEIGTPGASMVYQQLRTRSKLHDIPDPTFFSIKRNSQILGSCTFCNRISTEGPVSYIRYFSFSGAFKAAKNPRRVSSGFGSLKKEVTDLFCKKNNEINKSGKSIFYAYLDESNKRSARLCQDFGFEALRKFKTLTFSRIFPKLHPGFRRITAEEAAKIASQITETYQGYSFFTNENIRLSKDFFVISDGQENILAGVQAVEEHWKILEMPGLAGKFMLQVFSRMPLFNRLIARDLQFLAFENVFVQEGKEYELQKLLESVLAMKKRNIGLISMDSISPLAKSFEKVSLGLANKFKKPVEASVIVNTKNLTSQKIKELRQKPAFISTLDLT